MTRVVIVDDHQLVREGIKALLERAGDIEIVGEAGDGLTAVHLVAEVDPDVVVMDMTVPGQSGLEAAAELRESGARAAVVILTMHADDALVKRALDEGVRGFVVKGSIVDELLLAVQVAKSGGTYVGPTVAAASDPPRERANYEELTDREREVLELISQGLTNQAVASNLSLSVKTVERHRQAIMKKLDAHNIVELLRAGIRLGYISLED